MLLVLGGCSNKEEDLMNLFLSDNSVEDYMHGELKDLDDDGYKEMYIIDGNFNYYSMRNDSTSRGTPHADLFFEYSSNSFKLDNELIYSEVSKKINNITEADNWDFIPTAFDGTTQITVWEGHLTPPKLISITSALMFSGRQQEAKKFLDNVWTDDSLNKESYWQEFKQQLAKSKYWKFTNRFPVQKDQLVERDGIYYKVNSQTPFTGRFYEYYFGDSWDTYKEGKRVYTEHYYENGQLHFKGTYMGGDGSGFKEMYYKNGQFSSRLDYIDGVLQGDIYIAYDENGQIRDAWKLTDGEPDFSYSIKNGKAVKQNCCLKGNQGIECSCVYNYDE